MSTVRVADNFHCMDKDEVDTHGGFAAWAGALEAAQRIVDACLLDIREPGMSAAGLFSRSTMSGDDPFIVPTAEGEKPSSA